MIDVNTYPQGGVQCGKLVHVYSVSDQINRVAFPLWVILDFFVSMKL